MRALIISMLMVLILISGCIPPSIKYRNINPEYLENHTYCESDDDCIRFCCGFCGNKYWVETKIRRSTECCRLPEGPISGCKCVNNICETILAQ